MPDGTLIFDTRIDNKGFDKGLNDLGKKASSSAGDVMKGILGSSAVQKGWEMLKGFGQQAIDTASDLTEVQNVVDVTFGQGAAQIEKFSREAGTAFGLTELQAKQMTGTLGAMVKSMGLADEETLEMSQSLTALAGDMASFYNLDHETAFEKIRSGISGETEPLKALGINLSVANLEAYRLEKGLKKAYDKMSEAEKVQLRYGYIMEQTADAQGDFARTQDSFANQTRILQNNLTTLAGNIGSKLLPVLTEGIALINSFFGGTGDGDPQIVKDIDSTIAALDGLENRATEINNDFAQDVIEIQVDYKQAQDAVDKLDELREAMIGGGNLKLGSVGEEVEKLQKRLIDLGYEIETGVDGVFGEETLAALKQYQADMGLVVDGIAGVNTLGALNEETLEALRKVTSELLELYPELAEYVGENGVLDIEGQKVEELTESYRKLAIEKAVAARVEEMGGAYYEAAINMKLLEKQQAEAQKSLDTAVKTREALSKASAMLNESYLATGGEVSKNEGQIKQAAEALQAYMDVFEGLPEAVREMAIAEGIDLTKLIDLSDPTKLLDIEKIAQTEAGLEALYGVISLLNESSLFGKNQLAKDEAAMTEEIYALESAVTDAGSAIEQLMPQLETLEEEYQRIIDSKDELVESLTSGGKESGESMGENVADGLSGQKDAVGDATDELIDEAQARANRRTVTIRTAVQAAGGRNSYAASHATGLDYVPYNGYLASLHQGESVLTAAEAQAWRNGRGSAAIDYQALAAAVAAGQKEAPERPVVLMANGRVIAEALAGDNRTAINSYNRRVAEGMGKR